MGGAFAGLANDPSASYYNPAGLARLDDLTISASLTLNALDRMRVQSGFRSSEGSADLKHTSRPALPVFVGFVKQLGWKEGDARRHAIAFSTMTVERRRIDFDAAIEGGPPGNRKVDTLSLDDERSVRWYGLSYAYRVSQELSFGLSSFLSFSTMSHAEERFDLQLADLDPASPNVYRQAITSVHSTLARFNVKSGVFRLGVLYALSARLRFGAMFQPPSFHIRGKASVRDRILTTVASPEAQGTSYYDGRQSGLASHDPVPWELRLGVSWAPTYLLLFTFDASVYGKRGSKSDPVIAIGRRDVTPGTDRAPEPGDLVLQRWWGKRTGNVAVGAEYRIRDLILLRCGLFSDLSGAPRLPKDSQTYRPADISRLGATLSVGLLARGYDVSLGVVSTFGWGKTMAFTPDELEARYRRTQVQEQTFFVFLSGARRAVGKLAEDTAEKLKQRRQQQDED